MVSDLFSLNVQTVKKTSPCKVLSKLIVYDTCRVTLFSILWKSFLLFIHCLVGSTDTWLSVERLLSQAGQLLTEGNMVISLAILHPFLGCGLFPAFQIVIHHSKA